MSMNAKTGRFEVKTFVKRPSAATTPDGASDTEGGGGPSRVPSPELYEGRIKAPRMGYPTAEERSERVREVLGVRQRERRFFLDVDGLEIGYVEPRKVAVEEEVGAVGEETKKGKGRKRGRGKGKGKENDEAAAAEQHGRVDQEEEAEESAPEQIITSLAEAPAPDDLTVRLTLPSYLSILKLSDLRADPCRFASCSHRSRKSAPGSASPPLPTHPTPPHRPSHPDPFSLPLPLPIPLLPQTPPVSPTPLPLVAHRPLISRPTRSNSLPPLLHPPAPPLPAPPPMSRMGGIPSPAFHPSSSSSQGRGCWSSRRRTKGPERRRAGRSRRC